MTSANERQHGGDHYKSEYQHWDWVADTGMNYFQAQATRYLARSRRHEDGIRLNEDKAMHYLEKARERDLPVRLHPSWREMTSRFIHENDLGVFSYIFYAIGEGDYRAAIQMLHQHREFHPASVPYPSEH